MVVAVKVEIKIYTHVLCHVAQLGFKMLDFSAL